MSGSQTDQNAQSGLASANAVGADPAPVTFSPPSAGGTAPQALSPKLETLRANIATARTKGYTWDQINSALEERRQQAVAGGMSDLEFEKTLGLQTDSGVPEQRMVGREKTLLQPGGPAIPAGLEPLDAFKSALAASSMGDVIGSVTGKGYTPTIPADGLNEAASLAYMAGSALGDIPAMVAGGLAGEATSGPVGGAFGAGALPELIRSEYADAYTKGHVKGPVDFARRQSAVLWNATKAGVVAASVGAVDKYLGPSIERGIDNLLPDAASEGAARGATASANGESAENVVRSVTEASVARMAARLTAKTSAELATMLGVSSAVEGQLPTPESVSDTAIGLLGLKLGLAGAAKSAQAVSSVTGNLMQHWAETGEQPMDVGTAAQADPILRQELLLPRHPEPPVRSSETPTPVGNFVIPFEGKPAIVDDLVKNAVAEREAGSGGAGGAGGTPPAGEAAPGTAPEPRVPALQGPHDPWASVASRIATPFQKPGFMERLDAARENVYRELFDENHPLTQLTEAAQNAGIEVPDIENPAFLRRLADLAGTRAQYAIDYDMIDLDGKVIGPGLKSIVEPFKDEAGPRNVWTYGIGRRALALAKGAEGPLGPSTSKAVDELGQVIDTEGRRVRREGVRGPARASGVDLDDAHQIVEEGKAKYAKAFASMVHWRNGTLGWLRDAGVISSPTYDHLVLTGEDNLPGYRVEDEGTPGHTALRGSGASKIGTITVKAADGSELRFQHPYIGLLQDGLRRRTVAESAVANRTAADLAAKLGLAVKTREAPFNLNPEEIYALGSDLGGLEDRSDASLVKVTGSKLGWTFKNDELPIFRDGKVEMWKFADPGIVDMLRGVGQFKTPTVLKPLEKFSQFNRAMITKAPTFAPRILSFDALWQPITNPDARNVLVSLYHGLSGFFEGGMKELGPKYDEWFRSGGAERVFDHMTQDKFLKRHFEENVRQGKVPSTIWNSIRTAGQAYEGWAKMLNQSVRAGRYVQGIEAGESPTRAAVASTEGALHRLSTGGPVSRWVNRFVPFTTAHLKGLEQTARNMMGQTPLARAIFGDMNKTITGVPYSASKFFKLGFGLITVPSLMLWAHNRDKPWMKAVPNWQRFDGWNYHFGPDDEGVTAFQPLPPILGMLFSGIPTALADRFIDDNPHAFDGFWEGLLGALAPPFGTFGMANVVEPLIEKAANYNFFRGKPLTPDYLKENALPAQQYEPWTTETGRALARFASDVPLLKDYKLNGIEADNIVQHWGGPIGMAAIRAAETVGRAASVLPPSQQPPDARDLPFIGSYLASYPEASTQPTETFRERLATAKQIHGSVEGAIASGDTDLILKLAKEQPAAFVLNRLTASEPPPAKSVSAVQEAMHEAAQHVDPRLIQQVLLTQKALGQIEKFSEWVGALPVKEGLDNAQVRNLEGGIGELRNTHIPGVVPYVFQLGAAKTGELSPTDKSQILDWTYATMQAISEAGNKAMDEAKMP